jgi:high-affinity nickel permease
LAVALVTAFATLFAHAPDATRGDGSGTAVLMREASGWTLQKPVRRIFDNVAVATLSMALAIILGPFCCSGMVAVSIVVWPGAAIVLQEAHQPQERT